MIGLTGAICRKEMPKSKVKRFFKYRKYCTIMGSFRPHNSFWLWITSSDAPSCRKNVVGSPGRNLNIKNINVAMTKRTAIDNNNLVSINLRIFNPIQRVFGFLDSFFSHIDGFTVFAGRYKNFWSNQTPSHIFSSSYVARPVTVRCLKSSLSGPGYSSLPLASQE